MKMNSSCLDKSSAEGDGGGKAADGAGEMERDAGGRC